MPTFWSRLTRHVRLSIQAYRQPASPPFLVLFINSVCNMRCEHCFYWRSLNKKDDLTAGELLSLSRSLGRIENLSLSGGEPFLRKEFAEICGHFIRGNGVRQIYVPTNGWYTDKMVDQVSRTLDEQALDLFVVELSLDGMMSFHDGLRGTPGAFEAAIRSYDALADLQRRDPRLRIHANSTATNRNIDEIARLTGYLFERCPQMDHHNLAIIRGDRKDRSLLSPDLQEYRSLYATIRSVWAPRETGRYGAIVEPLLQWAKLENIEKATQATPCRAGMLTGVVYANGDVSVCELQEPIGNLRDRSFQDIWHSLAAHRVRRAISAKECHCSTEVFLWPSIVFQPPSLARALIASRAWLR